MKTFSLLAGLLFLPIFGSAQVVAPQQVQNVELTYKSSMTCVSILIASATAAGGQATQIISSTVSLWGSATVQNKDTSVNAYISDSIFVASATANGVVNPNTGFGLASGSPFGSAASIALAPGMLLYAVNDSGSRQSTITVCKGR